jgi:excinuclease UvrABC nuclease subunit
MALNELHPFNDAEIAKLPAKPGVYVFFQIEVAVHVDSAANLRKAVQTAKARFPAASHFSVEARSPRTSVQRVNNLRQQLKLVRTATFVGR